MKIRSGFVSNSSSSSFVIFGVSLKFPNTDSFYEDWEEVEGELNRKGYVSVIQDREDNKDREIIVGVSIARLDSDESWIESKTIDFEELQNKMAEMRKDFGVDETVKFKLFAGTQAS